MILDDLIPPSTTRAVAALGLHKVAGTMLGVPELRLSDAVATLGARAYARRKEARAVVDGIAAFGVLTGVKLADNTALMTMLRHAALPALAGAGIAVAPQLINPDPNQPHSSMLPSALIGGLIGGAGSVGRTMSQLPHDLSTQMANSFASRPVP